MSGYLFQVTVPGMESDTRKMIELWAARSDNIKNAIKAVKAAAHNSAKPLCEREGRKSLEEFKQISKYL